MVAVPNCFAFECDQMSPVQDLINSGLLGISYLIKLNFTRNEEDRVSTESVYEN